MRAGRSCDCETAACMLPFYLICTHDKEVSSSPGKLFVWSCSARSGGPTSSNPANRSNTRSRRANPPLLAAMVLSSRCSTSERHVQFRQLLAPEVVTTATRRGQTCSA